ncbi:MAG: hypothetical protein A2W26_04685 [Acidobacteria bacterium RBG_16_64_8]|nr:MAG: hypothetical protein A2W26_04685 [Acidobacteria bacterium RBG_16_64_8]
MTDRAAILDALLADPSKARQLPRSEAMQLVAQMAALTLALLSAPPPVSPTVPEAPAKSNARLLTMAEAAQRSRKSVRWLRDHWRKELPFAVRKGRSILFPEAEFERWLRRS